MSTSDTIKLQEFFIKTQYIKNIGLKDGLMGAALKGMLLSKETDSSAISNALILHGENLILKVVANLHNAPLNFGYGLAGIGWAIGLLIKENLIDGDADLFENIDAKIAEISIFRCNKSLFYGLEGYLHYILSRVESTKYHLFFPNGLFDELDCYVGKYLNTTDEPLKKLCYKYILYRSGKDWEYKFRVEDTRIQQLLTI